MPRRGSACGPLKVPLRTTGSRSACEMTRPVRRDAAVAAAVGGDRRRPMDCGYVAVSANDHFVFQTPWLDGLTALASIIERSAEWAMATTVSLAVPRVPVALAKARPRSTSVGGTADRGPGPRLLRA
jgi:hypothetical protein